MRLVTIAQRTPEWYAWRAGKATASRADVIAGCAPRWKAVRTWDDLRMDMAGLGPEPSEWMLRARERGQRMEATALDWSAYGASPACIEMDGDARFTASLDGLDYGRYPIAWVEIKCPMHGERSKTWRAMGEDRVPDHIRVQLVHQAAVIGDEDGICRLVCFLGAGKLRTMDIHAANLLAEWPPLHERWIRFLEGADECHE